MAAVISPRIAQAVDHIDHGATDHVRAPSIFFVYPALMAPGVRLMRAIDFRIKLIIVMLCFAVPLIGLAMNYYNKSHEQVDFVVQERLGAQYLAEIFPVLKATQDHRGLVNRILSGDNAAQSGLATAAAAWDATFEKLIAVDSALGTALKTDKKIAALKAKQAALAGKAAGSAADVFAKHSEIANDLLALVADVGETSNLVLDPDADSFYVMASVVMEGGSILEAIAATRGSGAGILAAREIPAAKRERLIENLTMLRTSQERQARALANAIRNNPDLKSKLDAEQSLTRADEFGKRIRADMLGDSVAGDPAQFWQAASTVLDDHYQLNARALSTLSVLLGARQERLSGEEHLAFALCGVFTLVAAYFLYAFFLDSRGGLQHLRGHIAALAAGDASVRPWAWGKDEVGSSLERLRTSLAAMSEMIDAIRSQAASVSHAAQEIAVGNQDLSARTEASASAIEQSARGMEQLHEQVTGNVAAIGAADTQIAELSALIAKLQATVNGLVQRMTALHGQSKQIAEIVGLIDGIAFQTNILAINASVEAARAGAAGSGFGVVAQEVRALAQRCAESARQINGIVKCSTTEIEAGTALAHSAGTDVAITVKTAIKVAGVMKNVRDNSEEQRVAVQQANVAIGQLASAAQSNASLVEEVAAATSSLENSGSHLNQLVSNFKLGSVAG